ncbi:cytochrome P450 [Pyrrhoderma noxium]|uniref:Cytochrome P450 n=1 Tax=Pyrrhoderma noxium TaxID=2282107 RepID=A0A286UHI3_9AGAM|nr:cytochrome P450 [Pyrrhoderma noxium]
MIVYTTAALFLVYIVNRAFIFQKDRSLTNDKIVPRYVTLVPPLSIFGSLLPKSWLKFRVSTVWDFKEILYKDAPLKTVIFQPLLLGGRSIYSANIACLRHVLAVGAPYAKPSMGVLEIMGANVVTSNGEIWKRHRRITAPVFNHNTYQNVWDTTAYVYAEMIKEDGWLNSGGAKEVNINENTHKLALFLVSTVGFGIPMSWSTPPLDENGERSIQSIVFDISANILLRGSLPSWAYKLGIKKLNDIDAAYNAFEKYLIELIAQREIELKKVLDSEGHNSSIISNNIKDILGRLVNSRLAEGKLSLTDEEIMGNCFIFAFAGHETTANTIAAMLAELAINPDKQEWLYTQIINVIGGRAPTFDDYDDLDCVLACFCEALRLYPAGYLMLRDSEKDDILSLSSSDNSVGKEDFLIKKGDRVVLDLVGMLNDPETYPNPRSFSPERWLSKESSEKKTSITKDLDAGEVSGNSSINTLNGFIGFSIGPRTCVGHKFAKVEAVAFLTHLIREWMIEPVKDPGETDTEWREKILSSPSFGITLAFDKVPLRFHRRST